MDSNNSVPSLLSIGYTSPGWPLAAFNNGIVTGLTTLAKTLSAKGHRISIIASQVVGKSRRYFGLRHTAGSCNTERGSAGIRRAVVSCRTTSGNQAFVPAVSPDDDPAAIAEREIQIIEMEESFGWPHSVCEAISIPVCVRLHGPWFLNGTVLGVPADENFREKLRDEGRAIKIADAVSAPSRDVLEQVARILRTRIAGR